MGVSHKILKAYLEKDIYRRLLLRYLLLPGEIICFHSAFHVGINYDVIYYCLIGCWREALTL